MGGVISTTEAFIEKNKKLLIVAIIAVVVVFLAIFGITKLNQSRNAKANNAMFAAEQYYAQGEYELALNGNTEYVGLAEVAKQYGNTKSGKRARYEAALCHMYLGQYAEATEMIKGYRGKDKITPLFKEIILGNAELEQGNAAAASKHYEKAIRSAEDYEEVLTYAIFLNGMAYYIDGNTAKANEQFNLLKQYPGSAEYRTADQYIGLTDCAE